MVVHGVLPTTNIVEAVMAKALMMVYLTGAFFFACTHVWHTGKALLSEMMGTATSEGDGPDQSPEP